MQDHFLRAACAIFVSVLHARQSACGTGGILAGRDGGDLEDELPRVFRRSIEDAFEGESLRPGAVRGPAAGAPRFDYPPSASRAQMV